MASRHSLSERALHEHVAEVEGDESQVTGIVGYFYAMYRAEVLARVQGICGRDILEVGCGEGMMFDGTNTAPRGCAVASSLQPLARRHRASRLQSRA